MKRQKPFVTGIIILLLASCSSPYIVGQENKTQTVMPSPEAVQTEIPKFDDEIQTAQDQWETLSIKDYRLKISFHENFANGLMTEREITVKNEKIVDSFCMDDKCPAFVFDDVYTVDHLFAVANGSTLDKLEYFDSPTFTYNNCVQELSFDREYGFPKSMSINCPNIYDEDHSFRVILFEILLK